MSPEALRAFLVDAVRDVAPGIVSSFGRTGGLRFKYGHEAITRVDGEVEKALTARIRERFPSHRIIGEEEGASGPREAAIRWTIDPIDGTLNYALGIPFFSTAMAVIEDERIVAGVVHDPLRQECFVAVAGHGAWCNDEALSVSDRDRAGEAIASTQSSRRGRFVRDDAIQLRVRRAFLKTRRLGSIALELAYVAAGRFDALLASKGEPQNLYDVAAGVLLVQEAGGRVGDGLGDLFREGSHELVASNGHLHEEILELVRP
jgi:myo-inositol-1(or 4)-monophosphatase